VVAIIVSIIIASFGTGFIIPTIVGSAILVLGILVGTIKVGEKKLLKKYEEEEQSY
jgi:hypothetical protein